MAIFKIKNSKLDRIKDVSFPSELYLQKLAEQNFQELFGLDFISGASNKEFSVKGRYQTFYIDTLAYDSQNRSFMIIEYKKDKSFSVIDQGYAYLSAMLNNKADFILEYFERTGKSLKKESVNWSQSKIIFISREYTSYQKSSIGFKDLPIELWEAQMSEGNLISFNQIRPPETQESITAVTKSEGVKKITKELSIDYEKEKIGKDKNLVKLFSSLKERVQEIDEDLETYSTNNYIGFKYPDNWRVVFSIKARSKKLEVELTRSQPKDFTDSDAKVKYMKNSKKHYNQHISHISIKSEKELDYAAKILSQQVERFKKHFSLS